MSKVNYESVFPFAKNQQDHPDAFIIKTNEPTENPHDVDQNELRRMVLGGKISNYEDKFLEIFYPDENYDPFVDIATSYKQKAEDYL